MKYLKYIFQVILLAVSQYSYANFNVGGFGFYTTSGNTVSVSSCNNSSGDVIIPDHVTYDGITYTVTSIQAKAFYYKKISSITIPSTITYIGNDAFDGCSSLTAVRINDLEAWCNISFDDGSQYFYEDNPLMYAHKLYVNGEELVNLVLPKGLKSVNKMAFYGCTSIQTLTMDDELESIGEYAFHGCSSLSKINFSPNLKIIDNYAFEGCSSLQNLLFPDGITYLGSSVLNGCSSLNTLKLPKNLMFIGTGTFAGCTSLTNVILPDDLVSIGSSAFSNCSTLPTIDIPQTVTEIGKSAFNGCTSLSRVNINNLDSWSTINFENYDSNPCYYSHCLYVNGQELTKLNITEANGVLVKNYAWAGLSNLTDVTISDGITSIGDYAFYKCDKLSSIKLPNTLTKIGKDAFHGCSSLTSLFIPQNVATILSYAFYSCSSLTDISIASNTLTCGSSYLFGYCKNLQNINISSMTPPPLSTSLCPFQSVPTTCKVYVPESVIETYKSAECWSNFSIDTLQATSITIKGDADVTMLRSYGDKVDCKIIPAAYCTVSNVLFNKTNVSDEVVDNKYTTPFLTLKNSFEVSFQAQEFDQFDINKDGSVDSQDVLTVYEIMKNSTGDMSGDVNEDGNVDSQDVLYIYEYMKKH